MAENCIYPIVTIPSTDCVGDSLEALNDNFDNLNAAACDLNELVSKRLWLEDDNTLIEGDTFTLNFSGSQIAVTTHPHNPLYPLESATDRKTIYIPLTGVLSLSAGDTVVDDTVLYPKIEIASYTGQLSGQGNVVMRLRVPPPIKQIRTLYYYGEMQSGVNSYPTPTRITSFVNELLNTSKPDIVYSINRKNDEVYVIYQKTAYATTRSGGASIPDHTHTYSDNVTIPSHTHSWKTAGNPTGVTTDNTWADHVHTGGGIDAGGSHSHSSQTSGRGSWSFSGAGDHIHGTGSYGGPDAGGHQHIINDTRPGGDVSFTFGGTTIGAGKAEIPPATIDNYLHTTFLWKLKFDGITYTIESGYPKFIQAKGIPGADVTLWKRPEIWSTYGTTWSTL